MDKDEISPEEKLLRAVNGEAKAGTSAPAPPPGSRLRGILKAVAGRVRSGWKKALEILELKLHELRERRLLPSGSLRAVISQWHLDLRTANRLLAVAAAVIVLAIVKDLVFFRPSGVVDVPRPTPRDAVPKEELAAKALGSLEQYTEPARRRNLFQPYKPELAPPPEDEGRQAAPAEGPQNLRVVAVATTDGGFEAIVEDVNLKETYIVQEGGTFQDYEVDTVDWETVVIKKGNQRWMLH